MFKRKRTEFLLNKLENIAESLERSGLDEIIAYRANTRKFIRMSFVGGLFRGLGMSIGFTILGALVIMLLTQLTTINLPLIGEFIAEIVKIVEKST